MAWQVSHNKNNLTTIKVNERIANLNFPALKIARYALGFVSYDCRTWTQRPKPTTRTGYGPGIIQYSLWKHGSWRQG